jgi:DNA-directed RNA polymerase specialized sigma subunit
MNTLNNEKDDLKLVRRINKYNCNDSFVKLSSRYENFYYSIAKKYSPILMQMGFSRDEIKYEKEFILHKAITSYDFKQKTKFSTWFCNCARYHFLNYINSNKKYIRTEDNHIDYFNAKDSLYKIDKNNDTFEYLSSLLSGFKDSRVKDVYFMRYFSENQKLTTWSVIGKKLNISTQTAINLHEKARVFLKKKIESKNFCDFV